MNRIFRTVLRLALCLAAPLVPPVAGALDLPADAIVLTISGNVTEANKGADAVFDMKMLEKLPQKTFSTRSPWFPDAMTFTGPLLRDVLAAAGAKGKTILALALNDYKTEIPFDDVLRQDAIIARLMNDKPMPVRAKGPLFIVYPYDSKSELRSEIYYNRSAWQLKALTVR
ncbi:MAG: hypothetical protein JWP29_1000 [Rhodoferax sp.]|nr:hypothetical protein [Rhodoferax sp.]